MKVRRWAKEYIKHGRFPFNDITETSFGVIYTIMYFGGNSLRKKVVSDVLNEHLNERKIL